MQWLELEKAFNRALYLSVSRKRLLLTFPTLVLCGILTIFCWAAALDATPWISLSLTFLPLFLSTTLLLALGVMLARFYHHETKKIGVNIGRLLRSSLDLMIGISYLSVPSLCFYLLFWVVLGIFFLLKEIPGLGEFFSVVLSFGPFLLIFASLILCVSNLSLLFFVAPAATLQSIRTGAVIRKVLIGVKARLFTALLLLLIGTLPLLLVLSLLSISASITNTSFFFSEHSLAVAMEWFFLMLPFAAIASPPVVFFFNFSVESIALLQPPRSS